MISPLRSLMLAAALLAMPAMGESLTGELPDDQLQEDLLQQHPPGTENSEREEGANLDPGFEDAPEIFEEDAPEIFEEDAPEIFEEDAPEIFEEDRHLPAEEIGEEDDPSPEDHVGRGRPYIESIVVEGNLRTRLGLIRRVLDINPGDPLDERSIEEGRLRLMALGLFRDVRLWLERGETRGRVILIVSLTERGTILLSDLFLGFTEVTPFYGGFGLADANLGGLGLVAHGAFVVGMGGRQAFRLSVSTPALWSRDWSASLGLTHLRGVELNCPAGLSACTEDLFFRLGYRRTGGRASLGLRSGAASQVNLHYRLEDLSAQVRGSFDPGESAPTSPAVVGLPPILLGSSRLSTLGVSWAHDTTDDLFLPVRGTRLEVHAEVGSRLFFSNYEYSRYGARLSVFRRGLGDHSIHLGLLGGFVQGDAPFFDRFHVADHSYFTIGAKAVPRALGVSFTEVSQYDDVLVSGDLGYRIPLRVGGSFVYRAYLHASAALTLSAHSVEGSLLDLSLGPRNEVSLFPLSGDVGVKLDTAIGVFSLGISYPLDLLL